MLVTPPRSWAGAWAKPQGEGLAVLSYYFYTTADQFGDGWDREDFGFDGRFTKNEWNLYVEYGLTDQFTLIGNFFLDGLAYSNEFGRDTNFGLADQEVGLRYQFAQSIPQALQFTVKIPGPYDVNDSPALGNGQTDIELDYYIGHAFPVGSRWGFFDLGFGYRLRTAEPADELRWYLTGGIQITDWLDIYFIEASGIHGLGNDEPQFVGDNILLTTDFDLIKIGASALVEPVEGWILQAGPYWHAAGRATGAGGGFKIAVWREF
ncbi:MAG: hypothetical protein WA771_08450 [Chthoniobacterales bacterium]